MSRLKND